MFECITELVSRKEPETIPTGATQTSETDTPDHTKSLSSPTRNRSLDTPELNSKSTSYFFEKLERHSEREREILLCHSLGDLYTLRKEQLNSDGENYGVLIINRKRMRKAWNKGEEQVRMTLRDVQIKWMQPQANMNHDSKCKEAK